MTVPIRANPGQSGPVADAPEALRSGKLRGKPTLIITGRSDALVPINHNERAYTAFKRRSARPESR